MFLPHSTWGGFQFIYVWIAVSLRFWHILFLSLSCFSASAGVSSVWTYRVNSTKNERSVIIYLLEGEQMLSVMNIFGQLYLKHVVFLSKLNIWFTYTLALPSVFKLMQCVRSFYRKMFFTVWVMHDLLRLVAWMSMTIL